jgi:hypothetical protein
MDLNSVLVTLAVITGLKLLYLLATGGFNRMGLAITAFNRVRADAEFARKVQEVITPPPPPPPPKPTGEVVRILAVLQRESRLIDFLMENIAGASDDQVGAAMKDLQPKAQATLKKHLTLTSVMSQTEGDNVEVAAGFDPSAIQLVGNVAGKAPYKGTLRHSGWKVSDIRIPKPPEGQDPMILAPAEVELP